jgi:hypothetical protein
LWKAAGLAEIRFTLFLKHSLFSLYDSRDNFAITFEIHLDPKTVSIKHWEIYPSRISRIHHLQSQCFLATENDVVPKSDSKKSTGSQIGNDINGQ